MCYTLPALLERASISQSPDDVIAIKKNSKLLHLVGFGILPLMLFSRLIDIVFLLRVLVNALLCVYGKIILVAAER